MAEIYQGRGLRAAMIIKGLKVTTLALVVISFYSFFTYFNALDFKAEAPLEACWGVSLTDPETGTPIVGVEDLTFDEKTGEVIFSAYDRRLAESQMENGGIISRGGFYKFSIAALTGEPKTLEPQKLSSEFTHTTFLPHGVDFSRYYNRQRFLSVNRVPDPGGSQSLDGVINEYIWDGEGLTEKQTYDPGMICHPNDLAVYRQGFFVTNDQGYCRKVITGWDRFQDESGAVYRFHNGQFKLIDKDLAFPNGVAVVRRPTGDLLAVALTRDDAINLYDINSGNLIKQIDVPGSPDNLTVDDEGRIYFTVFPSLLDYYFYISELFFVKKTPTGVFRIFPEKEYDTTQMLFHDNGTLISGASVAVPAGDYLIMGSAWDDNIAICKGINEVPGYKEFKANERF